MFNMRRLLFFAFLGLCSYSIDAQIGGRSTYQFLNVVSSPKIAALGGYAIAQPDGDLETVYFNPSLLSDDHTQRLDLNYTDYFSDINYGSAGYAFRTKYGVLATGVKYVHYGTFTHADEAGVVLGEFSASETAATVTWANSYRKNWHYGANVKFVYSNFFLYNSYGALLDLGLNYRKPEGNFTFAVVIKNIGSQIKPYTQGNYEPMPFEIQAGISQKLNHAPFRFSITAHNLQQPVMWYDSPNEQAALNQEDELQTEESTGDKVLRYMGYGLVHLNFGVEFLMNENFYIAAAYNHQRRAELALTEGSKSGLVGFSFGAGIKIKKFRINYARSIYHLAGGTNHIGISTNLGAFKKEKPTPEQ